MSRFVCWRWRSRNYPFPNVTVSHQRQVPPALVADESVVSTKVPHGMPVPMNGYEERANSMAQLPPWTQEVSERLIDLQIHTERMIDADGVRTPAEQALIDEFKDAQAVIQDVEDEITGVFTTLRTGKRPRRLRRFVNENEAA